MPSNPTHEFPQTHQSTPRNHPHPKLPTTEPTSPKLSYPHTHLQAVARFHHHWRAREYAAAADYAALAQSLALDAGHAHHAASYAKARQLAHKYQALKVELHKLRWNIAVDPILEPDDPPASEAKCNMVCTPDRPHLLQQSLAAQPHPPHQQCLTPPSQSPVEPELELELELEPEPKPKPKPKPRPEPEPEPEPQHALPTERSSALASVEAPAVNQSLMASTCNDSWPEMHQVDKKDGHTTVCCLPFRLPWKRAR